MNVKDSPKMAILIRDAGYNIFQSLLSMRRTKAGNELNLKLLLVLLESGVSVSYSSCDEEWSATCNLNSRFGAGEATIQQTDLET